MSSQPMLRSMRRRTHTCPASPQAHTAHKLQQRQRCAMWQMHGCLPALRGLGSGGFAPGGAGRGSGCRTASRRGPGPAAAAAPWPAGAGCRARASRTPPATRPPCVSTDAVGGLALYQLHSWAAADSSACLTWASSSISLDSMASYDVMQPCSSLHNGRGGWCTNQAAVPRLNRDLRSVSLLPQGWTAPQRT